MENYKENIIETRKGGLGSSDAQMVLSVARSSELTDSAKLRIAVMLGLAEKPEFNKSKAMQIGDDVELKLYNDIKGVYPNAESNPLYISEALSGAYGFNVLNHIDIETIVEDENTGAKTLVWFECKASKLSTADVLNTYAGQLAWHWLLLREKANAAGMDAQLFLLHYPTNGMFNTDSYSFSNVQQVEIEEDTVRADINDLRTGLGIIANTLPTFQWKQPEEIAAYNLPAETQEALVALKHKLDTIKAMEAEVNEFKDSIKTEMEKLYAEHGIKSIKCDAFGITYVAPSESIGFDQAKFKAENPEMFAKYNTKVTKRNGYVSIK